MIGAAEMLKASDKHPSILRKEITSPGGTTEEVLKYYKNINFNKHLFLVLHRQRNDHIILENIRTTNKEK